MRALHSRWGTDIFHVENCTGSSTDYSFSLNILSKDSKYTKPSLYWKRKSKIYYTSNVHLRMSKFGKRGRRCRDRKQDGHCSSRMVSRRRSQFTASLLSFHLPVFPQLKVRIKKILLCLLWVFKHAAHG